MTVERLKTRKEVWFWLIKLGYMFLVFPCLLLMGIITSFELTSSRPSVNAEGLPLLWALVWSGVLIPLAVFIYGVLSRRRLLKRIVIAIKTPQTFWPDSDCEMYHEGEGKYLGIDTKNGTILYVHRIRKGQVDVVGLSMGDWISREVEGNTLRLYTKSPTLPRIEMATPWAQRWYDTLGAMEHKQYDRSLHLPFAEYVADNIETLERDNRIQIPRLA